MQGLPDNWTGGIDELVEEANIRLANVLPDNRAARPKDEVNARLVRHYTTQGLLPAPWREGREARYGELHLLHLLALRRLMADGLSGNALYGALDGKNLEQLLELATLGAGALEGFTLPLAASAEMPEELSEASNAAVRYLQKLKRKPEGKPPPALRDRVMAVGVAPLPLPAPAPAAPAAAVPAPSQARPAKPLPDFLLPRKLRQQRTLRSVEVQPGLEVQVASDFDWPEDEEQWQALLAELRAVLHEIEQDGE